jgi:sterol desaturase/sphingolipid hydroxylase (fatty acid hydroxylase superfamily)
MHWRPLFKYAHAGHHKSIAPTPWAIYAFQPLEAAIQAVGIMLIVIFIPLHPLMLLAFLWYDTLVNTAGHTGYEVVPPTVSRSWFCRGFNTVAHHDAHHTNMRKNFGSFFNIWDRLMGTFLDATVPGAEQQVERETQRPSQSMAGMQSRQPSSKPLAQL